MDNLPTEKDIGELFQCFYSDGNAMGTYLGDSEGRPNFSNGEYLMLVECIPTNKYAQFVFYRFKTNENGGWHSQQVATYLKRVE